MLITYILFYVSYYLFIVIVLVEKTKFKYNARPTVKTWLQNIKYF